MNIASEQEMYDFGYQFANHLISRQTQEYSIRELPEITTEDEGVSPVTTGASDPSQGWMHSESAVVIELIGDVGAGKTTFTRGLAAGLGVSENVTSPSFTISKSYACADGHTLTHYDFYRLSDPGIMATDLHEKLSNPAQIIVIEWGTSVASLLPDGHLTLTFTKNPDNSRTIAIFDESEIHSSSGRGSSGPSSRASDPSFLSRSLRKPSDEVFPNSPDIDTARSVTATSETFRDNGSGISEKPRNDGGDETCRGAAATACVHLYLDTSTSTTILKLNSKTYEWLSGHELAEKLLAFIHAKLIENHYTWRDISEITFMSGPGSFTGLRIGATIVNTLAHELDIPLKDHHGHTHKIILPDYGRPANITAPKK